MKQKMPKARPFEYMYSYGYWGVLVDGGWWLPMATTMRKPNKLLLYAQHIPSPPG
jgi:hypothetical protein